MWNDDPEARLNKKINRIARSGAYALGGGVGLWLMYALYPREPGAEKMASLFGYVSAILFAYGFITLTVIMFKKNIAIPVNLLLVWLALPLVLFLLFTKFWVGGTP